MHENIKKNPAVKACCKVDKNRVPHYEPGMGHGISCEKCFVCGCRHFSMSVDPTTLRAVAAS